MGHEYNQIAKTDCGKKKKSVKDLNDFYVVLYVKIFGMNWVKQNILLIILLLHMKRSWYVTI